MFRNSFKSIISNKSMINTGSKDLDDFIGGYGNHLTMIYGKAATGKTTCCMLAAIEQLKQNKKVIYIDTENGFSLDRFKQLAGEDYNRYLDNLFISKINDFKNQGKKIKELMLFIEKSKFSLIIVDTIGIYYRRIVKSHKDLANNMLISQIKDLQEISKKVPVIITNQVYNKIDIDEEVMLAYNLIERYCSCLIQLNKNIKRKIKLIKPVKKEMFFEIEREGLFKVRR